MHSICFGFTISPNLTAVYDQEKMVIKLSWQNNDERTTKFVLQKSDNNYNWTDLYTIEANEFSERKIEKYSDKHPDASTNYYRLKQIIDKDNIEFSQVIMVIMGQATNSWLIYPIPVTQLLNLQYTGSDPITDVISVFILNTYGKILVRLRSSSLSRSIKVPVANLGKGFYDVRIIIGDKIVWNQRFVK
ncbi:MAG: hypothetical protein ABI402_09370 [Ferruginibacter sp.]